MNLDILTIKDFLRTNLDKLIDIFKSYESLLNINADKAVIIGDLHGDLQSLINIINDFPLDKWIYVALGDYVDRGEHQLETLYLLLKLKENFNDRVFLLRGNHESPLTNFDYGFYIELIRKLGFYDADAFYEKLTELFANMPLAAVLNNTYFLVHGGLPKDRITLEEVAKLPKPDLTPSNYIAFQMLWNDPSDEVQDYAPNYIRGPGTYLFGPSITEDFLGKNDLSIIIRGHEYVEEGYKWNHGNKVLTVFTSTAGPYVGTKPHVALVQGDVLTIQRLSQSGTARS